jgi:hypothetical protein
LHIATVHILRPDPSFQATSIVTPTVRQNFPK